MDTLRKDFENIARLGAYRDRATALRDRGVAGLSAISHFRVDKDKKRVFVVPRPNKEIDRSSLEKWLGMGNKIEAALLMMVRRMKSGIRVPSDMNAPLHARRDDDHLLAADIESIKISNLLPADDGPPEPEDDYQKLDRRIPILLAANALQVLTGRAAKALSAESMYCYYAILQELNLATRPDWIIGAARAGQGGNVSVFVTGECMRAIRALEHLHRHTAQFFADTRELYEKYLTLRRVINSVADSPGDTLGEDHPIHRWAEQAIQRMWLDWFVSVNRGGGELCFQLPPDPEKPSLSSVRDYLRALPEYIKRGLDEIVRQTVIAHTDINEYLGKRRPHQAPEWPPGAQLGRAHRYAREYAEQIIHDAVTQASKLAETAHQFPSVPDDRKNIQLLQTLERQFSSIAMSIRRVLDPSERYVEGALNRAIAESETQLDAGELVFSACSYGDATNWHSRSRQSLQRACAILLKSVPESGMLATGQPFHSTPRGYKLFPTSCEILRSLAVLIERTAYKLDETAILAIGRMLDAIDNRKLDLANNTWYGWNFEGATEQHQPSVWVSCVAVLSLDRLVRMLDSRINAMVLEHFDVIQPSKPPVSLNDLIFSDYGLALGYYSFDAAEQRMPMAIQLAEMRAHITRVRLPKPQDGTPSRTPPCSAVLYGPPQTGKTTLAEALAHSSNVPLVRLSSFDLASDPGESIESRGRVIFDALSMLTNAVILFDEFESVLPDRDEKHERSLEFLLTGLLPKLVKLHDLAQSQGLVYFLATNHIERIDPAAIRRGRFDLEMPVYTPDALSRAVACIYRLHLFRNRITPEPRKTPPEWTDENWRPDVHSVLRLLNVVAATIQTPPSDLAKTFFPVSKQVRLDAWRTRAPYFSYILETTAVPPPLPDLNDEPERLPASATRWDREQAWLHRFEYLFQRRLRETMQLLAGKTNGIPSACEVLRNCLQFPALPQSDSQRD